MDIKKAIKLAKDSSLAIYGSEVNDNAKPYNELSKNDNFALIMGNEAHGVSKDILVNCDENIYIPILGKAESLNVAVAAGVLMYGLQTL